MGTAQMREPSLRTSAFRVVATDLEYPEGPIYEPDGSVLVVEIAAGRLTRIRSNGSKEIVAQLQGGPNGAAIGPDGAVYICNDGGFSFLHIPNSAGKARTIALGQPADY